jgi:hypothetical protein
MCEAMYNWPIPFLQQLATSHEVVIFDNPGVGNSTAKVANITIPYMADATLGLIKALSLSAPVVLGAWWSWVTGAWSPVALAQLPLPACPSSVWTYHCKAYRHAYLHPLLRLLDGRHDCGDRSGDQRQQPLTHCHVVLYCWWGSDLV